MVKCLPNSQQADILAVLNAASAARHVFPEWRQRAIVPISKVPGSVDLADARPISLLDVLSKAYWSIICRRVTAVWERRGFFDAGQYGSRSGSDVQTPLAVAVSLSELACADHVPLLAVASDISRAFDSIPTFLGKEVALRRFGLPDDFLDHYLSMDRGNVAHVVTAYGTSSEILGPEEGTFPFVRGTPQGSSESPSIWLAFYHILMDMQADPRLVPEGRVDLTGAGLRRPPLSSSLRHFAGPFDGRSSVCGLCFVDDALWFSTTRRGLEMRLAVCSLFFEVFCVQFNVRKTKALGVEHFEGSLDLSTEDWVPWVYDTAVLFADGVPQYCRTGDHIGPHTARTGSITMVPLKEGVRYLGITWSPDVEYVDVSASLRATVDDFLMCMDAVPVSASNTLYIIDSVLWAKLSYQFRFARFDRPFVTGLQRRVEALLLKRAKLSPRVHHDLRQVPAALGGPGLSSWYDRIFADRLEWLERLLRRDGLAGRLVQALICQSQTAFGSSGVFESPLAAQTRWISPDAKATVRFGWVQGTLVWAAENDVQLAGASPLPGAAGDSDVTLVDLATHAGSLSTIDRLRRRCHECDMWWASSFLALDGQTFHGAGVPSNAPDRAWFLSQARRLLGPRCGSRLWPCCPVLPVGPSCVWGRARRRHLVSSWWLFVPRRGTGYGVVCRDRAPLGGPRPSRRPGVWRCRRLCQFGVV